MSNEGIRAGWAWITPDELPEERPTLRGVYLPAHSVILACVTGALDELANAENWVVVDGETPEETAEYFRVLIAEFVAGMEAPEAGAMVPIGAVMAWWSTTPPEGYLRCNYTLYDRASYPLLYDQLPVHLQVSETQFRTPNMTYGVLYGYSLVDIQAWQTFVTKTASGTTWPMIACVWIIRAE